MIYKKIFKIGYSWKDVSINKRLKSTNNLNGAQINDVGFVLKLRGRQAKEMELFSRRLTWGVGTLKAAQRYDDELTSS